MAEPLSDCLSFDPPDGSPIVQGLLGVEIPYNYGSGAFDQLDASEVEALVFGHRLHGRTLRSGLEHGVSVSPDGTAVMFGDWGSGAATAQLVGDSICFVRTTTTNCGSILRNPGGAKTTQNEYIWFASKAAFPFSQLD
jgi:hypothetical protein